jgi:putative colanic acid biosynthesis acetyltransferase WcaF
MRLDLYQNSEFHPGASLLRQALWFFVGDRLVQSRLLPSPRVKVIILRWFGAKIGLGVNIKPGVKVKFPWRLIIGDHVWLGENVWIDNLATVTIESHVCISQGAYLCTGNHDWSDERFSLKIGAIYLQEGSWLGAKTAIAPGVVVGRGAVLTLGSTALNSLEPMTIYTGNPARAIKARTITPSE